MNFSLRGRVTALEYDESSNLNIVTVMYGTRDGKKQELQVPVLQNETPKLGDIVEMEVSW